MHPHSPRLAVMGPHDEAGWSPVERLSGKSFDNSFQLEVVHSHHISISATLKYVRLFFCLNVSSETLSGLSFTPS